jgi:uncharacterized protein (TIGR00730 family)
MPGGSAKVGAACVALVGLFLGWQAVLQIAVVAILGLAILAVLGIRFPELARTPWIAVVTLVTGVLIVAWRRWDALIGIHGEYSALGLAGGLVVVFLVSLVHSRFYVSRFRAPATGLGAAVMNDSERQERIDAIVNSPSYRLAELDTDFLQQSALRPVRLQLELLKPEMAFEQQRINSTIVVFGGTQIVEHESAVARLQAARQALAEAPADPHRQRAVVRAERILAKSAYYDAAREFGRLVSSTCQTDGQCDYVIVTGGGPGIMEAANRGAFDVGSKSIGLNITLPAEQAPNPYIAPELCFQFHYFALRKMHFLLRARALVVFPGGFGTLDELFDALTLRQTRRMQDIPIILYGRDYWKQVVDFQFLADEGVIADAHLELMSYADTPQQAWEMIAKFHGNHRLPGGP